MTAKVDQAPGPRAKRSWKRWVSLRTYGLVTSTLFGATISPLTMRARFERLSRVSREKLQRKFPRLLFQDHAIDELAIESICAVEFPTRVILYLHGGAFFMGSPASYRNRAMHLSYRCHAEVFVPALLRDACCDGLAWYVVISRAKSESGRRGSAETLSVGADAATTSPAASCRKSSGRL